MNGIIALDIDGTITDKRHTIDPDVLAYLESVAAEGWSLVFLTGRPFVWTAPLFHSLSAPLFLGVQNGAVIVSLPSKEVVARKYLPPSIFPALREMAAEEGTDFVVYAGLESGDIVYYRPTHLPATILAYALERAAALGETWVACKEYDRRLPEGTPSIKFLAKRAAAKRIETRIIEEFGLHAPMIADPFHPDYYVVQATHAEATKGLALHAFIAHTNGAGPIIAAGDDFNDIDMLQEAHERIVMATAPPEVLALATVIAPPAREKGLIVGIEEAIKRLEGRSW